MSEVGRIEVGGGVAEGGGEEVAIRVEDEEVGAGIVDGSDNEAFHGDEVEGVEADGGSVPVNGFWQERIQLRDGAELGVLKTDGFIDDGGKAGGFDTASGVEWEDGGGFEEDGVGRPLAFRVLLEDGDSSRLIVGECSLGMDPLGEVGGAIAADDLVDEGGGELPRAGGGRTQEGETRGVIDAEEDSGHLHLAVVLAAGDAGEPNLGVEEVVGIGGSEWARVGNDGVDVAVGDMDADAKGGSGMDSIQGG